MTRAYIRIIVQNITCCAKVKDAKSKDVELATDSSGSSEVGDNSSEDFAKNV